MLKKLVMLMLVMFVAVSFAHAEDWGEGEEEYDDTPLTLCEVIDQYAYQVAMSWNWELPNKDKYLAEGYQTDYAHLRYMLTTNGHDPKYLESDAFKAINSKMLSELFDTVNLSYSMEEMEIRAAMFAEKYMKLCESY